MVPSKDDNEEVMMKPHIKPEKCGDSVDQEEVESDKDRAANRSEKQLTFSNIIGQNTYENMQAQNLADIPINLPDIFN
jgi:hypothetical protein